MFFLVFLIIVSSDVAFCSNEHNIKFFEQELARTTTNDKDIDHFLNNSRHATVERSAYHLKGIYPKPYSDEIVHDFTPVNTYNLLAISTILLAAESVKVECPEIFNFLKKNGLCGKDCGDLEEVFIMRGTTFKFNKQNKKFIPEVEKFVQLFLYVSCWPQTPFVAFLEKQDYKDKLFDIVAEHYVDENDIKTLRVKYEEMGEKHKEKPSFKLLLDKYDAKKSVQILNDCLEKQREKNLKTEGQKLVGLSRAIDEIEKRRGSYIPYIVVGGGFVLYLLYSFLKKTTNYKLKKVKFF